MTPAKLACEYCGTPLADPHEEAFNLAFLAHLRAEARCLTLFEYGMAALRAELAIRHGRRSAP